MVPLAPNSESSGWAVYHQHALDGGLSAAHRAWRRAPFVLAILPSRYNAAVTTRTTGVVLLALLLAGFLLIGALPNQAAAIRVAGLSLLWWYGGCARAGDGGARVDQLGSPSRGPAPIVRRMTSVARILAVWLTPTVALAVPAALAARGPDGLWLGSW